MIRESEVISILLGFGVLIFILGNRSKLERLPASKILVAGFYLLFSYQAFGILEDLFLGELLNFVQHVCYSGSALLLTVWCWKVSGKAEGRL